VTELGFQATGPGANRRVEFPIPSLWAKLLEEIRLGHSSVERRPEIANVKNGVMGRTVYDNFCSREHPLREVIPNPVHTCLNYVLKSYILYFIYKFT